MDLLLFLNATPATFTWGSDIHRFPVKKIAWFVDNPRRYVFNASDLAGCDVIGGFDYADYTGRRMDFSTELPLLYASAKININIYHVQCLEAPNPRVYDVLAAGVFC